MAGNGKGAIRDIRGWLKKYQPDKLIAENGKEWPPSPPPAESVWWAECEDWMRRTGGAFMVLLPDGVSRTITVEVTPGQEVTQLRRELRELRLEVHELRKQAAAVDRLMAIIGPILANPKMQAAALAKLGLGV